MPHVMSGSSHKTTAIALQNRRLTTVTTKRGVWQVALTEAERYFLDHGMYPAGHWDRPMRDATPARSPRRNAKRSRHPRSLLYYPLDQLIADVTAAPDGRPVVTEQSHGYWANLVSTATRNNNVPSGKVVILKRGRSWNARVIGLRMRPRG